MIQLYYYPSNASMAPHMVLEEIGCLFELVLVDRAQNAHKSADYLKLNPTGLIPLLVDDGTPIHQAAAICLHLADRFPDSGLAPPVGSAQRARLYSWLMYLTNTLQAELLHYFYPERMADDAAMAARVKAHAEIRVVEMLDLLENHLAGSGPFVLGDSLSIADHYLLMLCRWTRMHARPAQARPSLSRFIDAMAARPAVQRVFAKEGLPLPWA
ncbi:MAG TPA: glutathione S-transferase family protein [Usitatibacteraceae bacterium]|nr:glutathione S-transferase family protein [Usitatibacteraceae bacterium]